MSGTPQPGSTPADRTPPASHQSGAPPLPPRSEPRLARLVTTRDLTDQQLRWLLRTGEALAAGADRAEATRRRLLGRTVVLAFFENSTRTRVSFELAAKRLGADTLNLDIAHSSVAKGESLIDTVATLDAMDPDAMIVRHGLPSAARIAARHARAPVINAGSGVRAHPTQALLDALTLLRIAGPRLGRTLDPDAERPLDGLRIAIVGDIVRSRVARSNIALFRRLGADLTLVGPEAFLPRRFAQLGVRTAWSLEEGLTPPPHVVYALRVQHERETRSGAPDVDEYRAAFGITEAVLRRFCRDALVMHPGPVNRGIELSPDIADGERSLILDQVRHGVAMRMAILLAMLED